jgi:hypothetical protein
LKKKTKKKENEKKKKSKQVARTGGAVAPNDRSPN